jgi:hypothetical protein
MEHQQDNQEEHKGCGCVKVALTLPGDLHSLVTELAESDGVSQASIVKAALKDYFMLREEVKKGNRILIKEPSFWGHTYQIKYTTD